jgi:hypothetical protein
MNAFARGARTGVRIVQMCGVRKLGSYGEVVFMDESAEADSTLDRCCGVGASGGASAGSNVWA